MVWYFPQSLPLILPLYFLAIYLGGRPQNVVVILTVGVIGVTIASSNWKRVPCCALLITVLLLVTLYGIVPKLQHPITSYLIIPSPPGSYSNIYTVKVSGGNIAWKNAQNIHSFLYVTIFPLMLCMNVVNLHFLN